MYTKPDGTLNYGKIVRHSIFGIIVLIAVFGSFVVVSPQEKGIVIRLGQITRVLDSGLSYKWPLIEKVIHISVATEAAQGAELSYSKDAQTINVTATVNYNVDPSMVKAVYQEFKTDYQGRLVLPQIKESIKSVLAGYTAQGLLDNRPKLAEEVRLVLSERIGNRGFVISSVAIDNLDFDEAYEVAVRNKQVAEQKALEQINVTRSEDEKKKQEILKAQALAEKTRLEAQALQSSQGQQLVEKIRAEAEVKRAEAALEAAKKWGGVLPTHMYGSAPIPFLNLSE